MRINQPSTALIFTSVWLAGASAQTISLPPDDRDPKCLCAGGGLVSYIRIESPIEPSATQKELLPKPPTWVPDLPPWHVNDRTQAPEVFFQKPMAAKHHLPKDWRKMPRAELVTLWNKIVDEQDAARAQVARILAQINYLNRAETDRCVTLLTENRHDLAGLPFIKGPAARMNAQVSVEFVRELHTNLPDEAAPISASETLTDDEARAKVAAWMQTSPEDKEKRGWIVKILAGSTHPATTRALAKLAVFAPEKTIRTDATIALKDRPRADYTSVLLDALRYPWPEVAENAADVMVKLQRNELVDDLVSFLNEPDPRAPFPIVIKGRKTMAARDVVRLNHHHNCITCHAPATSDPDFDKSGRSENFISAPVTIPSQLFASSFYFGGMNRFPDIEIRTDVTYLRQDFSLMLKVENGISGAAEERFDFLVRTRELAQLPQFGPNFGHFRPCF